MEWGDKSDARKDTRGESLNVEDAKVQEEMNKIAATVQARLDENEKVGMCDFCGRPLDPKTQTIFATSDVVTGFMTALNDNLAAGTIDLFFNEAWAACEGCSEVVRKGDPVALAKHALDSRETPMNKELRVMVEPDLVTLYTQLYRLDLAEMPREVK